MPAFTPVDGGFLVAPGRYAFVASDWTGSVPDPRTPDDTLGIPLGDTPAVTTWEGMDILVLPMGRDAAGCTGRTLALGASCLVCFGHVAIVALPEAQGRHYPYASHIDLVAVGNFGDFSAQGRVDVQPDCYEFHALDLCDAVDRTSPGAFDVEGHFIDMCDEHVAAIFGYGTDAFNARLDEHGFLLNLREMRERLSGRTDPDAIRVSNILPDQDYVIAYYAPVAS